MPTKQKYTRLVVLLLVIVLIGVVAYLLVQKDNLQKDTYTFMCKDNKSIVATFYPTNDTHVDLKLSDGRTLSLPHAISASGARYTTSDEAIVFWNKGTTAFITEGAITTYVDCNTEPTANATSSASTGTNVVTVAVDGMYGYASNEYGFSLRYPKNIVPQNYFTTFYNLASNWRLNASQANQGKGVVSFPIFRIDRGGAVATGKAYPLFYVAELRIGVSPNVTECYAADSGYTNQKITNVTINGVTFKKFSTQDAGMMKYMEAESYRTVHNNKCYVLEQIKHGSGYRDETMSTGISDVTLNSYYNTAGSIAKTFKFTK